MVSRWSVQSLLVLATDTALGYAAASGKIHPFSWTDAVGALMKHLHDIGEADNTIS